MNTATMAGGAWEGLVLILGPASGDVEDKGRSYVKFVVKNRGETRPCLQVGSFAGPG
jgi:hypothetical protein